MLSLRHGPFLPDNSVFKSALALDISENQSHLISIITFYISVILIWELG